MRSSGAEVLEELRTKKEERKQANFYIKTKLLRDFQKACDGFSQSSVVEKLIEDFVQSVTQAGKSK